MRNYHSDIYGDFVIENIKHVVYVFYDEIFSNFWYADDNDCPYLNEDTHYISFEGQMTKWIPICQSKCLVNPCPHVGRGFFSVKTIWKQMIFPRI